MAHIRINIPAWNRTEWLHGAWGAVVPQSISHSCQRLREALGAVASDRVPILLSSARYGLTLAIEQMGLSGRRIAIPAYVCPAVVAAVHAANAHPVPVDLQPNATTMSSDRILRLVETRDVDAILAANTYGLDQNFDLLGQLPIPVIEDAAYQMGRRDEHQRPCGLRTNAGVWSFNFKALTSVGGGVLWLTDRVSEPVCKKPPVIQRVKQLIRFANYSTRSALGPRIPRFLGGAQAPSRQDAKFLRPQLMHVDKYAMSPLQAEVALTQWNRVQQLASIQQQYVKAISQALRDNTVLQLLDNHSSGHLPHVLPVLVRNAGDAALEAVLRVRGVFHACGVQTDSAYPECAQSEVAAVNACELRTRLFVIPCGAALHWNDVDRIIDAISRASQLFSSVTPQHREAVLSD